MKTIIFFLALLCSIFLALDYINAMTVYIVQKINKDRTLAYTIWVFIITCLWTYFYYL